TERGAVRGVPRVAVQAPARARGRAREGGEARPYHRPELADRGPPDVPYTTRFRSRPEPHERHAAEVQGCPGGRDRLAADRDHSRGLLRDVRCTMAKTKTATTTTATKKTTTRKPAATAAPAPAPAAAPAPAVAPAPA